MDNFEPRTLNVEPGTMKTAEQKTDVREVELEVLRPDRQQPGAWALDREFRKGLKE